MPPTVSVIIPIYNVEAYLRACLDSILYQTYTDWECIMVDDASTDSSAAIAREYCLRDPRFRLIQHSENRGLSATRNSALDSSHGEFVTFIDSDDFIHAEFLQHHIRTQRHNNADIVISRLGTTRFKPEANTQFTIADPKAAIAECLYQRHGVNSSACAKLFRTELFSGVRFREHQLYEDLQIMPLLWEHASIITYTNCTLYQYRQRSGSIINTFSRRRLDVLKVTAEIENRYSGDPLLGPAARDRRLSANFNIFLLLCSNGFAKSADADECWSQIKRLRRESLFNPKVRIKNKIGILASYLLGRRVFAMFGKKC